MKVIVPLNVPASVEDGAFRVSVPVKPIEPKPCFACAMSWAALPRPARLVSVGDTGGAAAGLANVVKLLAVPLKPFQRPGPQ